MSIRSHYTNNSYQNRPLTSRGSHRDRADARAQRIVNNDTVEDELCEACKNCEYKKLVDSALAEEPKLPTKPPKLDLTKKPITNVVKEPSTKELEDPDKKVGLFTKFTRYVAKNQAANRAAGEKSLGEEASQWGRGILSGAGSLGQEEIDGLSKKKSVKKSAAEDDELIDFLSGKRRK